MKPSCPAPVRSCLERLAYAGHPAYLTGSCVRTLLTGRTPARFEAVTPASPEQLLSVLPRAAGSPSLPGTVTVETQAGPVLLSSLQGAGTAAPARRQGQPPQPAPAQTPEQGQVSPGLLRFLTRRDFTVNAMAMGASGRLYDPFHGKQDLQRRQLRCVGGPAERFQADPLLMLRCIRLAAQLGFSIEEGTLSGMAACAHGTAALPAPQAAAEVEGILLAPWPEWGNLLFPLGLLAHISPLPKPVDLRPLKQLPLARLPRWAGFWLLLHRYGLPLPAEDFLTRMGCPPQIVRPCAEGQSAWASGLPQEASQWSRLAASLDAPACLAAAAMGALSGVPGAMAYAAANAGAAHPGSP